MTYATFLDGADHYSTADVLKKWSSKTGTITVNETGGRSNGGHIVLTAGAGTRLRKTLPQNSHFTFRLSILLTSADLAGGGTKVICALWDGDNVQCLLTIDAGSLLLKAWRQGFDGIWANPVLLATSSETLALDSRQYIEFGVHVNNSGSVKLRINGSEAKGFDTVSADTSYTGNAYANGFSLGAPDSSHYLPQYIYWGQGSYDDIAVSYGDELVWKGSRRVDYLPLTANDTQQDWTVSSGNAWEALNGNGESIQSSTLNAISRFVAANLEHAPLSIDTIQLIAKVQKSDSGDRAVALLAKSGSDEVTGASQYLSETSAFITEEVVEDPATSSAWTESGINNLIIGVKVAV